ncbi:signal peptidase I [Streptococcus suis]|uniref:signal peptidase I n=1 Tax=Streptococcus suis TaxID=1307 RepID=UPI00195F36DD|nr:signal peptidase I [Streptococcus suis]MBM7153643.1 signal peptidase I [Streptococcus suis]MDG4503438.1 signal peptidase I [Streptococcus suis]
MVKRDLIKQISLLVLLILGIIGLRFWLLEPVTITPEMANSYLKENDFIMTVRNVRPIHGDFILYNHEGKEYVSRVIALENETVIYMDDVLYRNDIIVTENYLKTPHSQESYTDDFTLETLTNGKYNVIPEGHYLVLNDVRTNQQDSRSFGLISSEAIVGRLTFRISPLSEFGFIKTGLVQ